MKVGGHDLDEHVLVVAEIGNNHEGSVDVAVRLVDHAADAGVDAVKFQTFRTPYYVSRTDAARYERLQGFELSEGDVFHLAEHARLRGLLFISTPFDLESAAFLEPLVDAFKIASGDNLFYPLLARVAASRRALIVSAGLTGLDEIQRTLAFVLSHRPDDASRGDVAVLHCVTAYPVQPSQVNLRVIQTLAASLSCTIGYSDHSQGLEAALLAVALGARIVEKHFTLSKTYSTFRDHALSADPAEMRELVRQVRVAEAMLGDGVKRVQPAETDVVAALRRSVVASADLPAGHVLRMSDVTWIRPGGGLPPGEEGRVIGRALLHPVSFGEPIGVCDVQSDA